MSKRKITVGVVTITLLVAGSVWAFRSRTDPQVEKITQLSGRGFKKGRLRTNDGKSVNWSGRKWINSARTSATKSGADARKVFSVGWTNGSRNISPCPRRTGSLIWINKSTKWRNGERNRKHAMPSQANPAVQGAPGDNKPAGAGQRGPRGRRPRHSRPRQRTRAQRRDSAARRVQRQQRAQRSSYIADMRARRIQQDSLPRRFPVAGVVDAKTPPTD